MRAVILSGLDKGNNIYSNLKNVVIDKLRSLGYESSWIDLFDKEIDYCNGCGYCTEKEAGVCAKKDDMQGIFPKMANYEFLIYISSITFGGYNSQLKKAVDRYSALGLPTYTIRNGELHHPMRYSKPDQFMSIGIIEEENSNFEYGL